MVLVDTSIWIDHLHNPIPDLLELLDGEAVLAHPFVIGELAMGTLKERRLFLRRLEGLPIAALVPDVEVLAMIELDGLYGLGIGYIDAHLLAATRLTAGARLWTRDKRLARAAEALDFSYRPS